MATYCEHGQKNYAISEGTNDIKLYHKDIVSFRNNNDTFRLFNGKYQTDIEL